MQKQLSPSSSLQPWPYNKNQTSPSDTLNQHPHNPLPSHLPTPSQAYWTLPSRRVQQNPNDTVPRSSTPNSRERQSVYSCNIKGGMPPISKSNNSTNKFFSTLPPSFVSPPLPYYGNTERQQDHIVDSYCFKSPTISSQPPHRWLVDSNHNVMHSAAPTASTPTSKYTNSLPRHFEDMSPIKSPTIHNDPKIPEFSKQILTTFSVQNKPVKNPKTDGKLKDVAHSPLFTPKTTMPSDELFALIHRSKKKMNIRTDLDSPVRSCSPASHSSLSPGSSESSLTGIQPPKNTGTRNSWSPQEGSCNPSSPPIVNGTRSSPGSRISWAGNSCNVTPPTSRTDFKRLLLQQRHGGGNRVSAAERLKVGKFGGTLPNSPNGSYSTLPMNGSPRGLNLLPMNSVVTPRNRINSSRRFASPRTDVLSSPILEDKDEEEIGNEMKIKKNATPTHLQNGSVNNEVKNSVCHKATDISVKSSQKNLDNNKSNGSLLSFSNSSISKSQSPKINEQSSSLLSNRIAKSILHSPSPTLGALMNKQKKQSPSPNSSLGPSVKSILEAIQVSKAKSSSKVALETALLN
ncbi:hypothetical protein J437_LFUL007865 [Ladona fulva]|uniref:Uncharacterized protein n=1 Tax=Ladona fulva TaxID=123851 RepID=A0A8K0JX99_LADFU|nr:hypothetical protein J437_LFUL007865 [Ladona fulva]